MVPRAGRCGLGFLVAGGAEAGRAEERVGQGDGLDVVQVAIGQDFRVDEEADRHVQLLAGLEALLVEAEALDLAEVPAGLERRDVEGRGPGHRLGGQVARAIVGQPGLADLERDLRVSGKDPNIIQRRLIERLGQTQGNVGELLDRMVKRLEQDQSGHGHGDEGESKEDGR